MDMRVSKRVEDADIRALLDASDLPVQDLDEAGIDFIVAVHRDRVVGVVGVEAFESSGLLRSLAVEVAHRNTGVAGRLADAAELHARDGVLCELVLLTQTAESFFARRGYEVIERNRAPDAVQSSAEFRSICPASAICMRKHLTLRA
jgi:amino-acid N-acetyltransferase